MEIFNKQPLCMLCLDIINESFKMIIDKFTEYASDTVFKQVFDDDSKTGICSGCSAKLYAALQFRLTCINIESTIIPYIDDEGEFPAEIKKIFLKYRKTDMALIDSEDNNIQVCRLCFQIIDGKFRSLQDVSLQLIQDYIPEMNFSVTKDPVICKFCFDSLALHSGFISNCFDVKEKRRAFFDIGIRTDNEELEIPSVNTRIKIENMPQFEENRQSLKHEEIEIKSDEWHDNNLDLDQSEDPPKTPADENTANGYLQNFKNYMATRIPHVEELKHECPECGFKAKYKSYLNKHMLIHKDPSEIEYHQCNFCTYMTKYKSNLKGHLLMHKDSLESQWYDCSLCNFKSKYKNTLGRHMVMHKQPSEVQWFECCFCDYKSRRRSYLTTHMLTHKDPSEIQWFECDLCGYKSKQKGHLTQHMSRHRLVLPDSSKVLEYNCTCCEYKSKNKSHLQRHMLTHNDSAEQKSHKCPFCHFRSRHQVNLQTHMLVHKNSPEVQWHQCDLCDFKSKYKNALVNHLTSHKDPAEAQWQKCDLCDYKTKWKTQLKEHMLSHEGRPLKVEWYSCSACDYKSKFKGNLRRHQVIHQRPQNVVDQHAEAQGASEEPID